MHISLERGISVFKITNIGHCIFINIWNVVSLFFLKRTKRTKIPYSNEICILRQLKVVARIGDLILLGQSVFKSDLISLNTPFKIVNLSIHCLHIPSQSVTLTVTRSNYTHQFHKSTMSLPASKLFSQKQ